MRQGEAGVTLGMAHGDAEAAGLRAGDVIQTVDGLSLTQPLEVLEHLAGARGQTITITVSRPGQTVTCEVLVPQD